jgi:hypothetical protein
MPELVFVRQAWIFSSSFLQIPIMKKTFAIGYKDLALSPALTIFIL